MLQKACGRNLQFQKAISRVGAVLAHLPRHDRDRQTKRTEYQKLQTHVELLRGDLFSRSVYLGTRAFAQELAFNTELFQQVADISGALDL